MWLTYKNYSPFIYSLHCIHFLTLLVVGIASSLKAEPSILSWIPIDSLLCGFSINATLRAWKDRDIRHWCLLKVIIIFFTFSTWFSVNPCRDMYILYGLHRHTHLITSCFRKNVLCLAVESMMNLSASYTWIHVIILNGTRTQYF